MTEDKAANAQSVLEGCGMIGPELPFGRRGRLVAERLYTAPITAGFGVRVAHEVTDEAFAAGRGEYVALCGCIFVPAPLAAPPGRPCPACLGVLAAAHPAAATPRQRVPGLLRRLVPVRQLQRATTGKDVTP
ncbi:MAG: hypothetical protein ACRDTH_02495 [Pseudonocardiaceae bacterium]